jgi:molybdopterin-guanine dinucleotide biosynthesis protein A
MGRDKALLPHPDGGTWLERSLQVLSELQAPITLCSRWPQHRALAEALQLPQLDTFAEPPPWEGPLLALHRLMERYPEIQLLLAPVDMPHLNALALQALLQTSQSEPGTIHVAHDGSRRQPLLGIYPSSRGIRQELAVAVQAGERRFQSWLDTQTAQNVHLCPATIRNINHPGAL